MQSITNDEDEQAKIHYEIFKINNSEKNRQIALELFKRYYRKKPMYYYKNRIEELKQ